MGPSRVFFPQGALDAWLAEGRVELAEGILVVRAERRRYRLIEAVRVLDEVTGAPDDHELIGRVKSLPFLHELGADVLEGSMVLGDNAYTVVPGWMGTPIGSFESHRATSQGLAAAGSDEALLAQYLLENL